MKSVSGWQLYFQQCYRDNGPRSRPCWACHTQLSSMRRCSQLSLESCVLRAGLCPGAEWCCCRGGHSWFGIWWLWRTLWSDWQWNCQRHAEVRFGPLASHIDGKSVLLWGWIAQLKSALEGYLLGQLYASLDLIPNTACRSLEVARTGSFAMEAIPMAHSGETDPR